MALDDRLPAAAGLFRRNELAAGTGGFALFDGSAERRPVNRPLLLLEQIQLAATTSSSLSNAPRRNCAAIRSSVAGLVLSIVTQVYDSRPKSAISLPAEKPTSVD